MKETFIVDVEATCWDNESPNPGDHQGDRPNEVIEIGICALNINSLEITKKKSYVIRPRFTSVSPFCTKLTGWTQADVDKGVDIALALQMIEDEFKVTKNHSWWSYGAYDRIKLDAGNIHLKGSLGEIYRLEKSPFSLMRNHFNVKALFAMQQNLEREPGMAKALNILGEKLEGRHHNGLDDALNIAKIVKFLLR